MNLSIRIATFKARLARGYIGQLFLDFLSSKSLSLVLGIIIGVPLKKWFERDWLSFSVCLALGLIAVIGRRAVILRHSHSFRTKTLLETRRLMRPEPEAEAFAGPTNMSKSIVGTSIEIFVHPNLNELVPLNKSGWAPDDMTFVIRPTAIRSFDRALEKVGGIDKSLRPPNGTKIGLDRYSLFSYDSDQLQFDFYVTDYYTQQSVYRAIRSKPLWRQELANLDPSLNQIPNAFGLQAIVIFSTGDVLCMLRDERTDAEGGQWSMSFEEQMKFSDFQVPNVSPAEYLFRRAFVEEVFGCKSPSMDQVLQSWAMCEPFVIAHRAWGLFFEEEASHFQLLGFYWLNIAPNELVFHHQQARAKGWAGPDPEGSLYILESRQVDCLLNTGVAKVRGLYDARTLAINVKDGLHRTSLYRLWRLQLATGRSSRRGLDKGDTSLNLAKT